MQNMMQVAIFVLSFTCSDSLIFRRLVCDCYHGQALYLSPVLTDNNGPFQDANFGRYQITSEELIKAMKHDPKVNTALICIGEGAEASWFVFLP